MEIKLKQNKDGKTATALDLMTEFYNFLQGYAPDDIKMGRGHQPKLSSKKAFTVLWYLQEHLAVFPDDVEQCGECNKLYDSGCEGIYWETKGNFYCGSCSHLVPRNYDRGKR